MGDAGEGLVDAEARMQERMDERARERAAATTMRKQAPIDTERSRQLESLRLARAEMQRQHDVTTHILRRSQIELALAEIDRRIAAVVNGHRPPRA